MASVNSKGFTEVDATLTGTAYRNATNRPTGWVRACPLYDGIGANTYFYKGLNKSNCIDYVISLGLI